MIGRPLHSILRHALDKIAEIKSLLEERRIGEDSAACWPLCSYCFSSCGWRSSRRMTWFVCCVSAAKIAGVYSDSDPPRKTMRRGVLMTLLQQSAMTLPLWIGKPGDRYTQTHSQKAKPEERYGQTDSQVTNRQLANSFTCSRLLVQLLDPVC